MVKYSEEAIKAILNMIEDVQVRPQFSSLYKLSHQMTENLRKVDHPIYPNDGKYGYMMVMQAFYLFNTILWKDPFDMGTFFKVPATAITDTDVKSEARQWQTLKDFRDNFKNVRTAVLTLLEWVIYPAYYPAHMVWQGFGNNEPSAILARLQHLYGQPSMRELDTALLQLNDTMDRNQSVKVMLQAFKELQMFLLMHPKAGQ